MTVKEKYLEKIVAAMPSYQGMFPIVEGLKTNQDVRDFIAAYIQAMDSLIETRVRRGYAQGNKFNPEYDAIRSGRLTIGDAAKHLAHDNLHMLARVYEVNKGRKVPESWQSSTDDLCRVSPDSTQVP